MSEHHSLSIKAMHFGMEKHKNQTRKYTGDEYVLHCAEVVGVLVPILLAAKYDQYIIDCAVAIAWLHDVIEDCGVTRAELAAEFGTVVATGVWLLSDLDKGMNREERKRRTRERLADTTEVIQTIKCCDCWSNGLSIRKHDPDFFKTLRYEFDLLLKAMTIANPAAIALVRNIIGDPTEPKEYEVWMEGWKATGEENPASLLGKVMARSWREAREKVYEHQPSDLKRHWNKEKTSVWGCRLFRDEASARASFG